MANPGPAIAGIPNTELFISTGPQQRVLWPQAASTVTVAMSNGSAAFQYFPCNWPVTATRLDALYNIIAASTTTTNTAAIAITAQAGIYSSFLSANTAGSTTAISLLSWGSTQTTYSYASGNSGNTQFVTAGLRPVSVPININMQPGEYFVAFQISTSASSVGAATTALGFSMSNECGLALTATNYAEITATTNSGQGWAGFQGVYSATFSSNLPLTIPNTAIVQTGASAVGGNYCLAMRNY
jgi:hypothetical protein